MNEVELKLYAARCQATVQMAIEGLRRGYEGTGDPEHPFTDLERQALEMRLIEVLERSQTVAVMLLELIEPAKAEEIIAKLPEWQRTWLRTVQEKLNKKAKLLVERGDM